MDLLIDIGNTRAKWAVLRDGQLGPQQAVPLVGWSKSHWLSLLRSVDGPVDSVVAATVAGQDSMQSLREAAAEAGADLQFVESCAETAGVRNAYPEPAQLGVDRWLALIAAHSLVEGPCCVVDIGTAATIDTVNREGRHLGGFIVPGPELMSRSLMTGTSDLAERSARVVKSQGMRLADNTKDAIELGCVLAVAALVDRVVGDLEQETGVVPKLLLTGGAAGEIEPLLVSAAVLVPDLVLHGLAIMAGLSEKHLR